MAMAILVGVSRGLFGRKSGSLQRKLEGVGDSLSGHRGRLAEKPSEIPAKGWKDIVWRVYDGMQKTACFWWRPG